MDESERGTPAAPAGFPFRPVRPTAATTARPATLPRQFAHFAAVGAIGTLAHYTIYVALVRLLGTAPLPASAAGFSCGAVTNYTLNYSVTFRSTRAHTDAFWRFMTVALVGLALNSLIVGIAVALGVHYLLAQAIATALVLAWTFTGNRRWTFVEDA